MARNEQNVIAELLLKISEAEVNLKDSDERILLSLKLKKFYSTVANELLKTSKADVYSINSHKYQD